MMCDFDCYEPRTSEEEDADWRALGLEPPKRGPIPPEFEGLSKLDILNLAFKEES